MLFDLLSTVSNFSFCKKWFSISIFFSNMELEGQKTIQLKYKTRREALFLTVFHFKLPKSRLENNLCTLKAESQSHTQMNINLWMEEQKWSQSFEKDSWKLIFFCLFFLLQKSKSSKQQVVLTNLSLASGGTYRCEVSAEAPSFRTKTAKQDMVVVVLPSKAEIKGIQPKYQVGDLVNVTCFSNRY